MKAEAIIIQRPDHQKPAQRVFFGLVTLAAWAFWFFLWLPLITLFAWAFGVHTTYVEIFRKSTGNGETDLMTLVTLAACCAIVFIAWSVYNRFRFGSKVRRRNARIITPAESAYAMGTTEEAVLSLRDARISTIGFEDSGKLYVAGTRER
ncbi:biofilm PGA synthesis protein PgaD [Luteibacter sp. Sphag1AF]|uniref:poly-beta-1,6-N-acetyl-D-glucosamine biosynthesis protein PgaD n=1 Tax=Luteibacter sp. Sphag1AF TaxID=2587031 RepID=UPI00161C35C9|nr:poly-beta-1,6-N-acetyl-D-glucosamine biosynthesis protein PgaD [Luteibacter sp. Sphag1AF]MBB3228644.1 biofilm PGA synthesis protein PgaD [Luteibacter sp. Sphag1AF]